MLLFAICTKNADDAAIGIVVILCHAAYTKNAWIGILARIHAVEITRGSDAATTTNSSPKNANFFHFVA